ncbi:MAG: hypothetical protein ACEPOW_06465, partial [Bacteroidales bacterium]
NSVRQRYGEIKGAYNVDKGAIVAAVSVGVPLGIICGTVAITNPQVIVATAKNFSDPLMWAAKKIFSFKGFGAKTTISFFSQLATNDRKVNIIGIFADGFMKRGGDFLGAAFEYNYDFKKPFSQAFEYRSIFNGKKSYIDATIQSGTSYLFGKGGVNLSKSMIKSGVKGLEKNIFNNIISYEVQFWNYKVQSELVKAKE